MDERVTSALSALISDQDINEKAANHANDKTTSCSEKLIKTALTTEITPILKKLYPNDKDYERISNFVASVSSTVPADITSLRKEILSSQ